MNTLRAVMLCCGLGLSLAYSQMPSDGLLAHYPLNGDANDATGNGYDGQVVGAILATDQCGKSDRAYFFADGTEIALPNRFNSASLTFSAWIKTSSGPVSRQIFTIYQDNTHCIALVQTWRSDNIGVWMRYGGYDFQWSVNSGENTAPLLQWHHVCITLDAVSDAVGLYVDGVLRGQSTMNGYTAASFTSITHTSIGHAYYASNQADDAYNGSVDEVRIYDRALSPVEVNSIYQTVECPQAEGIWELAGNFTSRMGYLAVDAHDNLYLGSESAGTFRSTDDGGVWTPIDPAGVLIRETLPACNRVTGSLFLAGIGQTALLFRSSDAGSNWQSMGIPWTSYIRSFAFNKHGHMFVGTNGDGVWRSTDDGKSWIHASSGITEPIISPLYVDDQDNLYVGTRRLGDDYSGGYVFRSVDNGNSWVPILSNVGPVYALARSATGNIFVGCDSKDYKGLYRSSDNGASWTRVNPPIPNPRVYSILVGHEDELFLPSTETGVFRSTNQGDSWELYNSGVTNTWFDNIVINSQNRLFLSCWPGYVFRTRQSAVRTGEIAGYVAVDGVGTANVIVKLLDENGLPVPGLDPQLTDQSGRYRFVSLSVASYQVLVVEPLGLVADGNPKHATVQANAVSTVDFSLSGIVATNEGRSKGYWKHQFDVHISGRGASQETADQLFRYVAAVREHYTYHWGTFSGMETFEQWQTALSNRKSETMCDRARQQLAALVLNVVSLKIGQTALATNDGRTVADVMTFVSQLVLDENTGNDEQAKDLAESVNDQMLIGAGIVPKGNILYRLIGTGGPDLIIPSTYELCGNYPNPFNPMTTIRFGLPEETEVRLEVLNILGEVVGILANERLSIGYHEVTFDASRLPSGVYICLLHAGAYAEAKRILLLR